MTEGMTDITNPVLIAPLFQSRVIINSLPAMQCHLLITFATSLDPDQARQNVGPDMGPICLTL